MSDGEAYEYVKGTFKFKSGSTPDGSRATQGAWRGTTRDANGHLDGQAEFIPDKQTSVQDEPDPEFVYVYINDERAQDDDDAELRELLGNLVVLGVLVAVEKASPHIRRWWSVQFVPAIKSVLERVRQRREAPSDVVESEAKNSIDLVRSEVEPDEIAALEVFKSSMSSAEARDRFIAALVARAFSDEQWRILRDARIQDVNGSRRMVATEQAITRQQVEEGVALALQANPMLLDEQVLARLGSILGTSGAEDEYVPIRREQLDEAINLTRSADDQE